MRKILLLTIIAFIGCKEAKETSKITFNYYDSELFKAVQLSELYEDSKTFVDLTASMPLEQLEQQYLNERSKEEFDLKAFVEKYFKDTSIQHANITTDTTKTMFNHINSMWDNLKRGPDNKQQYSSKIPLPKPYVVPGGRFREIYYWDSYFTLEGLLTAGRKDLAKDMVANFSFLLDSIGFIPNGTRNYYLTRSQPPFYSLMVDAVAKHEPQYLENHLPQLLKEYEFWTAHNTIDKIGTGNRHTVLLDNGDKLQRYWDSGITPRPESYREDLHLAKDKSTDQEKQQLYSDLRSAAASGWDFSTRWYSGVTFETTNTTQILPVDLNCLLYFLEKKISDGYKAKGDDDNAQQFLSKAINRSKVILAYFWNEKAGYFTDYDVTKNKQKEALTLAGVFPLYFKIATKHQAESVKNIITTKFLKDGGVVTTLINSGQQWDAPNGWAPLQYMTVKALLNYGYDAEAKLIMERWLALNEKVFKNTGKMMEKYNVEDLSLLSGGGEYETQDGFGWTNGVALVFRQLLDEME